MKTKMIINLTLLIAGALLPAQAPARSGGNFTLTWSTLDGAGGTSAGGTYSMSGTVGQPDAGSASGGAFTFEGGFWPGAVPDIVPRLRILPFSGKVIVSWPALATGYKLQQRLALGTGTWSEVTTAPLTVGDETLVVLSSTGAECYYRLTKP